MQNLNKFRTVFLGSPDEVVPVLKHLLAHSQLTEIVGVISQPARKVGRKKELIDPPVAAFSKETGIPTLQFDKISSPEGIRALKELRPDLCITAAYGQILSDEFLSVPTRGTINIHPSRLPLYRGATPVQSSLLNGDASTAVSILFTVRKMDAGNIIVSQDFDIGKDETHPELLSRLFKSSATMLTDVALEKLLDSEFTGTPQDESKVTHCRKISKRDGFTNFKDSAANLYNKYRALTPWPGVYGYLEKVRISFVRLSPTDIESTAAPGFLRFEKKGGKLFVSTSDFDIEIHSIQPAGKKPLDPSSFWNGFSKKADLPFAESEHE